MSLLAKAYDSLISLFPDTKGDNPKKLRKLLGRIPNTTGSDSAMDRVLKAIKYAKDIGEQRRVDYHELFFANPLLITEKLVTYGADESTVLAAIIYPMVRPELAKRFDPGYFEKISTKFGLEVATLVRNTLQIREMDLLARTETRDPTGRTPQNENARIKNYHHMVREVTEDPRALLIRTAQWLVRLEKLPPDATTKERQIHVDMTKQLYIPLAAAYNFEQLRTDLDDRCLFLENPDAYDTMAQLIQGANDIAYADVGKFAISDMRGRQAAALREIRKTLEDALKKANLPNSYKIEFRVKRPASLYRKLAENPQADLSDIIAFRIIVNANGRDEDRALFEVRKGLARHIESYVALTTRSKNMVATPKPNGYRALHETFVSKAGDQSNAYEAGAMARFEVQIVGEEMNTWNEKGMAAHAAYKGFAYAAYEVASQAVSVYTPDNEIVRLPRGATVADLAVCLGDAEFAFSVESATIKRSVLNDPVKPDKDPLGQILASGDKVEFRNRPDLAVDAAHRIRIISACALSESRQTLEAQSRVFRAASVSVSIPPASPARPKAATGEPAASVSGFGRT